MPEEKSVDAVEKFLLEQKAIDDRKQALIDDLLQQRADAIKAFDEKLAKLGHSSLASKRKRNHHKLSAADAGAASQKGKTKA